jgi:fluoroacetyl-CoA thioesterase
MRSIPIGAKGSFEAVVRREDLASTFKDASLPPVLSTPVMIKFMENAALRAIAPYLDAGETAVGTERSACGTSRRRPLGARSVPKQR